MWRKGNPFALLVGMQTNAVTAESSMEFPQKKKTLKIELLYDPLTPLLGIYANNELSEREIKKTVPFMIASKRIQYLGINLNKDVKDLYLENYRTLKKETEEDTNK